MQRASEAVMIGCSEMCTDDTQREVVAPSVGHVLPPADETKRMLPLQSVTALDFSLMTQSSLLLGLISYVLYLINSYILLSFAWSRDIGL